MIELVKIDKFDDFPLILESKYVKYLLFRDNFPNALDLSCMRLVNIEDTHKLKKSNKPIDIVLDNEHFPKLAKNELSKDLYLVFSEHSKLPNALNLNRGEMVQINMLTSTCIIYIKGKITIKNK